MPAMICHYMIGYDVLERCDCAASLDRNAFLLGAQGPDIFYFSRAYPWLIGEKGMPIGNALHKARPSVLVDALRTAVADADAPDRKTAESYALGFLCHYAADRVMHPFVCAMQERMMQEDPSYASGHNPYHYRIESALDTILLRQNRGQRVERFRLTWLVPEQTPQADEAVAALLMRVINNVLCRSADTHALLKLRTDLRQSMWWMTDRFGWKHKAFRVFETISHKGAWYSSLIRTPHVDWYDFANASHCEWRDGESSDAFELYRRSVALAEELIRLWNEGANGLTITDDVNFSGNGYIEKELES